jgi:hypothetical protein
MKIKIILFFLILFFTGEAAAQYNKLFTTYGAFYADEYLKLKNVYKKDRVLLQKNKVKIFFVSMDEDGYNSKNYVDENGCITKIEMLNLPNYFWLIDISYDSDFNITKIIFSGFGDTIGNTKLEYTEGALKSIVQQIQKRDFTDLTFTHRKINGELRVTGYEGINTDGKHCGMDYVYNDEKLPPELEGKFFDYIDYGSDNVKSIAAAITLKNGRIDSRYYPGKNETLYYNYFYNDNGLLQKYTYLDTKGEQAKVYFTYQYYR